MKPQYPVILRGAARYCDFAQHKLRRRISLASLLSAVAPRWFGL